jgi:hypothetical protein
MSPSQHGMSIMSYAVMMMAMATSKHRKFSVAEPPV